MSNGSTILRAARFADEKHRGQVRKHTARPYITHPARVAGRIALLPDATESDVAAAWLHDVREDCGVTDAELRSSFGEDVADIVDGLTNRFTKEAHPDMNRKARKAAELARLTKAAPQTRRIKLADRADNLRELDPADDFTLVYMDESTGLREALRGTHEELEIDFDCAMADLAGRVGAARMWNRGLEKALHDAAASMKSDVAAASEACGFTSAEEALGQCLRAALRDASPAKNLMASCPLAMVAVVGVDVKDAMAEFAAVYARTQDAQEAAGAAVRVAVARWCAVPPKVKRSLR